MNTYDDETKNNIKRLIDTCKELSDRIDNPKAIPDSCYRGDVLQWNFAVLLSQLDKLTKQYDNQLKYVITELYGENSDEIKDYDRAIQICRKYENVYDLQIPDV